MSGMSGSGMSGPAHGGGVSILSTPLAIAWTVVFVAILVAHARHALQSHGERRLWHVGHVLMAGSMALMYAPRSVDPLHLAPTVWQVVFCVAAAGSAAEIASRTRARSLAGALWLLLAIDLAAMVYMWRPDRSLASLGWLLLAYFCAQALLWASRIIGGLDLSAGFSRVGGDRSASLSGLRARTVCVSMCAMMLGMAYMVVAMQLS